MTTTLKRQERRILYTEHLNIHISMSIDLQTFLLDNRCALCPLLVKSLIIYICFHLNCLSRIQIPVTKTQCNYYLNHSV